MLLIGGRILMLFVWAFLLMNIVHPAPKPLKYFIDVALFFMVVMHGLQLVLLRATQPKDGPALGGLTQLKIFFFGVFELLAWQKKNYPKH
ncbi:MULTISPECIES: DUF1145 family protein [Tatumella]|uniref:DUF1145 family protein n=1 Tax=Tatumella punctata TaxID=399969 RepID=A0ABW1VK73_9GAMM|nr:MULTISPECIES: DUF1145 family protein [unclassified Tatumella]MBS0855658.1 DUF1145 family protein [Tatumella sp. JGM16]MBS0876639.1 DUF1145 family protein [Tatumella sp. JGM82]MBS0889974.1 DUF1145 family protein [Tatumella sp. JGM94]MBS0893164.1 DUF1145 family protein [Tatumella sp. JGM130]MBS0901218.1 DUF1145 family protein [Tatumella sp. JGM100]